ncbi:MAG: hypothetical protein OEY67_10015, partial [Gammaproteobacteria bacterium]|nr:hypothetical protein [Gammaproteobacteria bacterium]
GGKPMATGGPNAGKPYGFTRIKLKLRNSTPAITEGGTIIPQPMTNGKLMLVAKYRTNVCYQPDLSGEPKDAAYNTWSGCKYDAIWTRPQDVSVSTAKVVDSAGVVDNVSLNSASLVQLEFDFSNDPIPVNAWDLYLQVVYRGQLGEESDAVVVHTEDIYEPSFYTNANNSDYVNVDGAFYTAAQIRASTTLQDQIRAYGVFDPVATNAIDPWNVPYRRYYIGGSTQVFSVALPIASYSRVSLLLGRDNLPENGYLPVRGADDTTNYFAGGVSGTTIQFASPTLLYVTLMNGYSWAGNTRFLGPFRGTHYQSMYHHNFRYSSLDADNLSGLTNFAPIEPVPVDLNY